MEPVLAGNLLEHLAQRIAVLARDRHAAPLRRAGAGARQWRTAQPGRSGCDAEQLRYAVATDDALALLLDDSRSEGATLVIRLTRVAVVAGLEGLAGAELDAARVASGTFTAARLTLDDPIFRLQLAYSRARRDAVGRRWEEADGIPPAPDACGQSAGISGVSDGSDALDRPGPTADLAAALLDAPRRLDPAGRPEQAWAALEAVATAYLVWEGEVPQHLPDGGLGPRLLAGATASVLERGMSGLGIVARERI
ncbi:MAG: hypothetical protein IPM08_12330 [Actinomycetales bacterium]|nr:hypothetical protein [Actinomycetales bacterium]